MLIISFKEGDLGEEISNGRRWEVKIIPRAKVELVEDQLDLGERERTKENERKEEKGTKEMKRSLGEGGKRWQAEVFKMPTTRRFKSIETRSAIIPIKTCNCIFLTHDSAILNVRM